MRLFHSIVVDVVNIDYDNSKSFNDNCEQARDSVVNRIENMFDFDIHSIKINKFSYSNEKRKLSAHTTVEYAVA